MSDYVSSLKGPNELPAYEVSGDELGPGASFGNGHTWVDTGTDGRVLSFFSTDVGEEVAGPLMVRYGSGTGAEAQIPLEPADRGTFVLRPASQEHRFELPGYLEVRETVHVPQVPHGEPGDQTVVFYTIEVHNRSDARRSLSVHAFARFAGSRRTPSIRGEYDEGRQVLFAWEEEHPDWVRALTCSREPAGCGLTDDFGALYDTDLIPALSQDTDERGDAIGTMGVPLDLEPGATARFAFILTFSPEGRARAAEDVEQVRDYDSILERVDEHLRERLNTSQIMTPEPVINEGAFWSKVNMLRVLAHYPEGLSFTNEPGVSSNVVARDAAWFVYGCDHFLPSASRQLLDAVRETQYENGMIPEYYDARTGETEDYGLNINDGTPLYVLAVNHHVRSTGDFDYLREVYDSVAAGSRYILSQRDDRGLVYCDADGVEVWGICSWRNVIPNYRINGAVTEVNAECAAALRAMGHMAENLGRSEDYDYYYSAAMELTDEINEHLLDHERQLYLLNIDPEGRRHTDVTADELFPVLFRVAPDEVAFRIIRRLNSPDFWTPGGLRTCSRRDPLYDPAKYVGLRGGVWPGLTWWYAFAAARYHPEFMVRGMQAAYEHYIRHPRVYNTVPGQFSEWFDGESLINRGMRLSPWEPPRFLWAAVEGVCGLMLSPEEPGIRPLIPPDWLWCAAVNVPYHDNHVTAFAARMDGELAVYANRDFKEAGAKLVLDEDATDRVSTGHAGLHPVALRGKDRLIVAIGSCRDKAITTPLRLADVVDAGAGYEVRDYSSEKGEWTERRAFEGRDLNNRGVRVEAGGFHLLDIRPGQAP